MNIQKAYSDIARKDGLLPDEAQQRIVDALQILQTGLEAGSSPWRSLLAKLGAGPQRGLYIWGRRGEPHGLNHGIYIWGNVGRGKTFLMDLFYENLDVTNKRRINFHRIIREVHARLKRLDDVDDPLDKVAAEIASETRVLCFDEFFVSDIADAMILVKLLEGLFARGVTLVATSNSAPADLYRNGLQRERFLPAISSLSQTAPPRA